MVQRYYLVGGGGIILKLAVNVGFSPEVDASIAYVRKFRLNSIAVDNGLELNIYRGVSMDLRSFS